MRQIEEKGERVLYLPVSTLFIAYLPIERISFGVSTVQHF